MLHRTVFRPARVLSRAFSAVPAEAAAAAPTLQLEELDKNAIKLYKESPLSFYQLPLDNIEFKVIPKSEKMPAQPQLLVKGNEDANGLTHLTPLSICIGAHFGENGTLGHVFKFTKNSVEVTEPEKAEQQVTICSRPLSFQRTTNDVFVEYAKWLESIREKFVAHLITHMKDYPSLDAKFGQMGLDNAALHKVITSNLRSPYRFKKAAEQPEQAEKQSDLHLIGFRSRLYRPRTETDKIAVRCPLDASMKEKKFGRIHIPLYDSNSTEIPVTDARIAGGDAVVVCNVLKPAIVDVAANVMPLLRQEMRSVVLVRRAPRTRSGAMKSPFVVPGGIIF